MNKDKEFLQKYVDHKLNSIRCDRDDLTDYMTAYTNDNHRFHTDLLDKWKIEPKYFIDKFNPTTTEIRTAIKASPILNTLAERYKQAVIKCIPYDIIDNILQDEKEEIKADHEEEEEYTLKRDLMLKIEKLKLTQKEKAILGLQNY